ncbi:hypothetical protein JOF56_011018 [Kibdelosporangium banguiense]|uniref:Uncharacterized protein n=1 Tax=Kibdelosporangium banguiense TaxID=1365924 RepID=A0ABS4U1T9_9PSEU|nr:hypothetical protein [Kibdelosporangium banguiense]MBP2330633.1 hypothetical protein [Kibdelosporangium banguiense]
MSETFSPPTPMATWNPARGVWETAQRTVCGHWEPFSRTWPTSGMTRHGVAYVLPTWEPRTPDSESSSLLPTPTARDHKGPNQRADDTCLHGALLPTPTTSDRFGPGPHGDGGRDLRTTVQNLLPTPTARLSDTRGTADPRRRKALNPKRTGELDEVTVHLLPTRKASDGTKGGPNMRGSKGDLALPSAVMATVAPTPSTGTGTSQPSGDGRPSSDGPRQHPLWPDDAADDSSTPDSSNG